MAAVVLLHATAQLRGLEALADRLREGASRTMRAVAEVFLEAVDRSFELEVDPWGNRWAPHSDVTLELYERGGLAARTRARPSKPGGRGRSARPRRRVQTARFRLARRRLLRGPSGQLRALVARSDAFSAAVTVGGQARAYGAVNQFGNPENRLPNRAGGRRAPIPARPFLPLRLRGARVFADLPPALRSELIDTIRDGLRAETLAVAGRRSA